jgi:PST family polysaccharide transporter
MRPARNAEPAHLLLGGAAAIPAAARGSTIRIAGYVAGVAVSAIGAAVAFRHLGVAGAGQYVLVIAVVTVASGLVDGGLAALAVTEFARREGDGRREVLGSLVTLRVALSAVGVLLALSYGWLAGFDVTLLGGLAIVSMAVLVQGVAALLGALLQADLRFGLVAAADFVRQAATAVGFALVAAFGGGLTWMWVALVPPALLALLITRGGITQPGLLRPSFDLDRARRLLAAAVPFAVTIAIGVLYFRVGVVLLDLLSSSHEVGLYGLSFRVIEVAVGVPVLLAGTVLPILAHRSRDRRLDFLAVLQPTENAAIRLGTALSVALIALAPLVVRAVGGPEYADAADVLRIHAIALWGTFVAAPLMVALLALRRRRAAVGVAAVAFGTTLVATLFLAALFDARGAAAASAAAEWALAIGAVVALGRCDRRPDMRLLAPCVPLVALVAVAGFTLPDWASLAIGLAVALVTVARSLSGR